MILLFAVSAIFDLFHTLVFAIEDIFDRVAAGNHFDELADFEQEKFWVPHQFHFELQSRQTCPKQIEKSKLIKFKIHHGCQQEGDVPWEEQCQSYPDEQSQVFLFKRNPDEDPNGDGVIVNPILGNNCNSTMCYIDLLDLPTISNERACRVCNNPSSEYIFDVGFKQFLYRFWRISRNRVAPY